MKYCLTTILFQRTLWFCGKSNCKWENNKELPNKQNQWLHLLNDLKISSLKLSFIWQKTSLMIGSEIIIKNYFFGYFWQWNFWEGKNKKIWEGRSLQFFLKWSSVWWWIICCSQFLTKNISSFLGYLKSIRLIFIYCI